jgi:hypothetical protein
MEVVLPIPRYTSSGTRRWLVERVVERRREMRAIHVLVGPIVVEPLLIRLIVRDDRMPGVVSMTGRVL